MLAFTTPVAFLIFNRPELTRQVFEEIRRARPSKLLVVADGPRSTQSEDASNCAAARDVIADVDWPCEVLTNYSDVNMGCKQRVSSGLDWVFNNVEEAIILEDDCLPHPTFFRFCAELLEKYRHDERVFHISGDHFRFGGERNEYSYYFSRFNFIWGWASWRRAWKYYDVEMKLWPLIRDGGWLETVMGGKSAAARWVSNFQALYDGKVDTWDGQWAFAFWINNGLSVRPRVNLISNIGFHAGATHTTHPGSPNANLPVEAMIFPLNHPPFMLRNAYEDQFLPDDLQEKSLWRRAKSKFKRALKRMIPSPVRKAGRFCKDSVNAAITLTVRTHKGRWRKVSMDPNPHWDDRNKAISSLIPDGSSVLDLGCGAQTLRRHLKPGCKYQPCDVIKSSPDVILCDFNANIYPAIAGEFDYVVCSGVFEYIRNPRKFLQEASLFGRKLILSYNPLLPEKSKFSRLAVNWNNHLTREETERLFDDVPLVWEVLRIKEEDGEIIYSLHIADKTADRGGVMEVPVTEDKYS